MAGHHHVGVLMPLPDSRKELVEAMRLPLLTFPRGGRHVAHNYPFGKAYRYGNVQNRWR